MPELPDIVVYIEALERRVLGERLERVRLANPFLLRTVDPPLSDADGRRIIALTRLGKRIAIGLEGDLWLVIHLMIAGRLRWAPPAAKIPRRLGLAAFDFETGTVLLTEAGTKKRASLHVVAGAGRTRWARPRGARAAHRRPRRLHATPDPPQSHAQASPHGSPAVQWDRQRLLRRDSPCGASVADHVDPAAERG